MKPVPHGEPYAGNLHVRFDEGSPPKNGEVRFEGSRRPSGRTRQQGALRSTLHPSVYGGTGKPLDGEGRDDVKHFFTEAGQTVLASCADSKLGKWGWSMINRGKPRNKVVCAIGHKLVLYAFHIMRGDPTPNRDGEEFFRRKMVGLHREIGAARMHELGFGTRGQFASAQAELIYGSLPEPATPGGATPSETGSH